jgi:hypothetical protein
MLILLKLLLSAQQTAKHQNNIKLIILMIWIPSISLEEALILQKGSNRYYRDFQSPQLARINV